MEATRTRKDHGTLGRLRYSFDEIDADNISSFSLPNELLFFNFILSFPQLIVTFVKCNRQNLISIKLFSVWNFPSTQSSDYNLFRTRIANTAYILWTLGFWFSYSMKILNNCLFTFKWIKIQLTMSKEPHIFFLAVQEAPRGSTARYEMNCAYSLKTTTVSPSSDDVCLVSEVMIPVRTRPSEWHVYHCLRSSFSQTCSSLSPANIVCNGELEIHQQSNRLIHSKYSQYSSNT